MKKEELRIQGMSCSHCVEAVRKELEKLTGLLVLDVRIGAAVVEYEESRISRTDLSSAIAEAGFVLAP